MPPDIAARLAGLSPAHRALLEQRMAGNRDQARARDGSRQGVPARDPGAPVPLSFAQWRLWFLEQLRPGTHAWNTAVANRLTGSLDVDALRRALALVVERHATLRTVFVVEKGNPRPVVVASPSVDIPVTDLTTVPAGERAAAAQRLVEEEVRRPFDLAADLMVRACLLRTAPDEHVLVVIAHHIACDGWSKGLLLSELCTAYDAFATGVAPEFADLPIDYADFAVWQRGWLTGDNLERLSAFWRERLAGAPPALELLTDRPRPATQAFAGAAELLDVPADVADAAAALGRSERATPFMTLLAAFTLLLHVRTGADDVLVGAPAAMRNSPELEPLIGFFANTLTYRTDLSGNPTFRSLVGRVRDTAVDVYRHQDLPFEKVVEVVRPPRDVSRNPIVQVNMRVEGREPQVRLHGIAAEPIVVDPGIARFDLAIELGATDDGYSGYLEYNTDLFDRETAQGFASDFRALLAAAVAAPDVPVDELGAAREIRLRRER